MSLSKLHTVAPACAAPRRERRKEARPGELLEAALDLFVEKGYAATRAEEVAVRAGVSKGTLFLYFPSKEELFKAVVRENLARTVTEGASEIEGFAGMKNISDEVLRRIGTNRDWTKKYTVISSLVKNPRTPLGLAMGFVSRLQPRDVKALAVDRNVPEAIRKSAQLAATTAPGRPVVAVVSAMDQVTELLLELGDAHGVPGVPLVDEVVTDPGALRRRRRRGADVHAPVHLHRVGADDLRHSGEGLGHGHRERGLP